PLAQALEPLVEAARAGTAAGMRSGDGAPAPVAAPARRGQRMANARSAVRRGWRPRAGEGGAAAKGAGGPASPLGAARAPGIAAGVVAALISRRRRRGYQWQQFEPVTGQSTMDGYGATVVVPVEEPSKPS